VKQMFKKSLFPDGTITIGVTVLAVTFFQIGLASGEKKELKRPEITVAFFYADWDPVCLRVDTGMERLANKYDGRPVLGILLDVSNQTNRHHAELLASALGLDEAWNANGDKTGIAYIVDSQTGEILDTLTDEDDMVSSAAKVDAALKKASK
jgi:hypothetical protein